MSKPVAKALDQVQATDTHIVLLPGPAGTTPTPMPFAFAGIVDGALSDNVYAERRAVAVDGSTASNTPVHVPVGGSFQLPPSNQAVIIASSATVFANNKPIARHDDKAQTCDDVSTQPGGKVIANASVHAGD